MKQFVWQPVRVLAEKWLAATFSLAMLLAVLWPIRQNWRKPQRDDFPLSYYPMFRAKRSRRIRITYAVGLDAAGQRHAIPYRYLGNGGMNQVRRQLNRIARAGDATVLCNEVARRLETCQDARLAALVAVQIVTGEYQRADYFRGQRAPRGEQVHATVSVRGRVWND